MVETETADPKDAHAALEHIRTVLTNFVDEEPVFSDVFTAPDRGTLRLLAGFALLLDARIRNLEGEPTPEEKQP